MSTGAVGIVTAQGSREKSSGTAHESNGTIHLHNSGASMLLWMLVDGIGLAIITACTILEGFELWKDYFNEYAEYNFSSLTFWFSGRTCQVVGLLSLITHAASMQVFHELELAGMMLLTAGPVLNICACSIFDSGADSFYIYNKQWMTSESLELLGILILDLSLIEGPEHLVLSAEVLGFIILACAAIIDFEYSISHWIPSATIRVDLIHTSDCFGLGLLTIVAIGQYHIKIAKHKAGHDGHSQIQSSAPKLYAGKIMNMGIGNSATLNRRLHHQILSDNGYDNIENIEKGEEVYDEEKQDPETSALLIDSNNRSTQSHILHRNNDSFQYQGQHQQITISHVGRKTPGKLPNGPTTHHEQHND